MFEINVKQKNVSLLDSRCKEIISSFIKLCEYSKPQIHLYQNIWDENCTYFHTVRSETDGYDRRKLYPHRNELPHHLLDELTKFNYNNLIKIGNWILIKQA